MDMLGYDSKEGVYLGFYFQERDLGRRGNGSREKQIRVGIM